MWKASRFREKTEQQPTSPSEHQQAETNTESRTTLNKTKKPLFQSKTQNHCNDSCNYRSHFNRQLFYD